MSRDRWIQSPECWPLHHRTDWAQPRRVWRQGCRGALASARARPRRAAHSSQRHRGRARRDAREGHQIDRPTNTFRHPTAPPPRQGQAEKTKPETGLETRKKTNTKAETETEAKTETETEPEAETKTDRDRRRYRDKGGDMERDSDRNQDRDRDECVTLTFCTGVTVAILAQGTEWADAITQAFLQRFNSAW